jgi:hypothetical protein
MTEHDMPTRLDRFSRNRRRDGGSTLPELLVTVMLLGLIVASLSSAVIVIVRQQDNSTGRLNVARSETGIGMWLPADLASAKDVDVTPSASPCGTTCPPDTVTGGSNAIMLSWTSLEAGVTDPLSSRINVSYRYVQVGASYHLVRVQCASVDTGPWSCSNTTVLRDLTEPPPATTWTPGVTSPNWVIKVSQPLDAGTIDGDDQASTTTIVDDPNATVRNAQRVVVTIDGGGDGAGAGGGANSISLTAGGVERGIIDSTSMMGTPSFNEARTRCGGNFGLIVDTSGSIGSAMPTVNAGLVSFINAFAGTPIKIQVVRFQSTATVIGQSPRTRYFDMLNDADVTFLRSQVNLLAAGGGTNWEDALHRMFYTDTGAVQQVYPEMVIFFTDGEPTMGRVNSSSTSTVTAPTNPPAREVELGSQEAFNRAKYIVDAFRSSVNFIGVGVGPAFTGWNSSGWRTYGPGFHYDYFRGFHYEKRNVATNVWSTVDLATYNATSPTTDRRIVYTAPFQYWEPTTLATYNTLASAARLRTKDYTLPYTSYDVVSVPIRNSTVLTRLIAGNDFGVPAVSVNGAYTNAATANMYLLPNFNQFAGALEAVALAECGGTLTLQTKVESAAAADPFTYQHTVTKSAAGLPLPASLNTVTTTRTYQSGTFDFSIPDGEYITVDIQPLNSSGLQSYTPGSWSCKAGGAAKAFQTFAVPGSTWSGIRVQVRANEAISCIQQVNRV